MINLRVLHTTRMARGVAVWMGCALITCLSQVASAQLVPGQWLQLNFTDGYNPPDKNEFNVFLTHNSGDNATTGNATDMIDSQGNPVPGVSLTAANWSNRGWDGASNLAPWPAGDGSLTPAAAAGRGDSVWTRDEHINFWWDAGTDTTASIVLHGLDPDLAYNVYYYSKHSGPVGGGESHTLDINGITQATLPRGDRFLDSDEDLFFSQVKLDGNGQLVMTWGADPASPAGYNPVVSAILVQAVVPEPATIGLAVGAVALLGVVRLRRKS